tara:strand:+ start:244 stop:2526 length:2283 start_codon:yes stop_codon:yes gene_type:complete
MNTWQIRIKGQVQGVGFRPYVYKMAAKFYLNGYVLNSSSEVQIEFNSTKIIADEFYKELIENIPLNAIITNSSIEKSSFQEFKNFDIRHSSSNKLDTATLVAPETAICNDCIKELLNHENKRYKYPFITCINCGPRYSLIHELPYDRENTSMETYTMCLECNLEYSNPSDRRFHSQTNSCLNCSIKLKLIDNSHETIATDAIECIDQIVKFWKAGKIVAIKGLGGYILTCDANNKNSIKSLRLKKRRPSKPFALMLDGEDTVKKDFEVSEMELKALKSTTAPIVLLKEIDIKTYSEEIAPGLSHYGIMFPSTPLQVLLLNKFNAPIIATSGNIHGIPIIHKNKLAEDRLFEIADYLLEDDREIIVPQDDSVIRFTTLTQQKIILRRSKGLAPTYINPNINWSKQSILATGALLKSSFSILHKQNTYISQYLGNLDRFETLENYKKTVLHFIQLFSIQPTLILIDKHQEYLSSQYGIQLADNYKIPTYKVQHHLAHFSAVLGENNLVETTHSVLGVIWDGTGLGDDGNIWGGEFFTYKNRDFSRATHFEYYEYLLGDKMSKEPRISALATCWNITGSKELLQKKFSEIEWYLYTKMLAKETSLKTSSIGRIFDAVASLLGLIDKQSYEGEAAMLLEDLAWEYCIINGLNFQESYFTKSLYLNTISVKDLMQGIIEDLRLNLDKDFIAAKFHFSLVGIIKKVAIKENINRIAFSGGVFQNSLLVELIRFHLKEHELYFHKELSPNDESISFGQLVFHHINTS